MLVVYFGGPIVATTLHRCGHTISVILFAAIWGGCIAKHCDLEKQKREADRTTSNLFTIEQKHYIESQRHSIACDLMTSEQKVEYDEQITARRLGGYYHYEYQVFDSWEYEQRK